MYVQIGDFGLARDLEDDDYYVSHGGQIPVKWTAPEVSTAVSSIVQLLVATSISAPHALQQLLCHCCKLSAHSLLHYILSHAPYSYCVS